MPSESISEHPFFKNFLGGGMLPDPPSISMLRMLVAAPPQFHYTLFCPPSAKILKETLLIIMSKFASMTLFVDGTVNQLQDMHLNTLFANLMTLLNLHCLYKDYEHVVIWV